MSLDIEYNRQGEMKIKNNIVERIQMAFIIFCAGLPGMVTTLKQGKKRGMIIMPCT